MSNATLAMAPTQWGRLKDIHEVEPINDGDLDCLAEIRATLQKHGKQDRFGVALLHQHFHMHQGEILVEETDVAGRVLTLKPVPREAAGETVETVWQLVDGEGRAMTRGLVGCYRDSDSGQAHSAHGTD